MRRFARALVAAAAVLAIAATVASPASATANHEIGLTGYTPLEVGHGAVMRADGVVAPPAEYWDASWILAVAIPASVMAECPADASSAGTVGEKVGTIIAIAMKPAADETGSFSNTIGYTPQVPGPVLICAYLYNDVGSTWAWSSLHLEVIGPSAGPGGGAPGGSPPVGAGAPAGPVNLKRPWVTSSGRRLACHPGTWSNATGAFAYNWLLDGRVTRVTGARPVVPGPAGSGHRVSCQVTAYGPGQTSTTVTSPARRLR